MPALGSGEIRSFTGLRGIAAVLVMLYHFAPLAPRGTLPAGRFLANGYLCVDLFFILSGFVLAYAQADHAADRFTPRSHAAFLLARIARIYPLYAVVALASAAQLLARPDHVAVAPLLGQLLLNLLMVQSWGLAGSLEGAAWSVSSEWCAYLLFPLLLGITVLSSRRDAWLAGLLAAVVLVILARSAGPFRFAGQARSGPLDLYSAASPAPLLRCLAEFSLGLLAFRVAAWLARTRAAAWCGPAALIVVALLLAALCAPRLDLAVVALFVLLIITLAQRRGALSVALGSLVPHRLGRWSYSIYLLHGKFGHFAGALRGSLARSAPSLPASLVSLIALGTVALVVIGCSALCHAVVEQPLRRSMLRCVPAARGRRASGEPEVTGQPEPGPSPAGLRALGMQT